VAQVSLVVHGHFYQPPRENPWTEIVPVEPTAAPFHDWNERVTAESYRPNGWARVVDEHERVVALVNNYAHLSFNIGPTLASWLADHQPSVLARMVAGDATGGGAIAQAYSHPILPLATERDIRTQVRWGLADFRHRFGREAKGMWLPEAAVDDTVLRVLAEEGVGFTILAPAQAAGDAPIDTSRAYRWRDSLDIVFYDGPLSHDVAFGMSSTSAQVLVDRVADRSGIVCIATDGETFGHHHKFAERALAYALPMEAPAHGIDVTTIAEVLAANPPTEPVEVVESSWSCVHGVERWRSDCGCSTGGEPGANQRWRAPLRDALDVLHAFANEVFERRGPDVLDDPWRARNDYIDVVLGATTVDAFADRHVTGDVVTALTLLEAQRHALLMYTSCGWFFWDLAGIETIQILRYAARLIDLLVELDEVPPTGSFLDRLSYAESNQPGEGTGRDVWERHVVPARVDSTRVVAHLALADLLEGTEPGGPIAAFDVTVVDHLHQRRGALTLCAGIVEVVHRRTRRRQRHAYAALHLGGLEVSGAVRAADDDRDAGALRTLRAAFDSGERVTAMLRLITGELGPTEIGLEAALPDAAEQIVAGTAEQLEARFARTYEELFAEHRATFRSLTTAGFPLSDDVLAAARVAFDRQLAAALLARDYDRAVAVVQEGIETGVHADVPRSRDALVQTLEATVRHAVAGDREAPGRAIGLLHLAGSLGIHLDLGLVQELLYDALTSRPSPSPGLSALGAAVGLAVERLVPQ
jgi:hypothetical protein